MGGLAEQLKLNPEPTPGPSEEETEALRIDIVKAWQEFQEAVQKGDKAYLRQLHQAAKSHCTDVNPILLLKAWRKHAKYFAPGHRIDPARIKPKLVLVTGKRDLWDKLFKLSRASWSMPYTKGYGRRVRFVVFDEYHEAVIGIIGLQSPPADLACRDELFDFPKGEKLDYVNCMLDAYTIGSVPPYSQLLGGKLVASLVASDEIRQAYWRLYAGKRTLMEDKQLAQPLLAVTTTSAFGRSSIYNRLRFNERLLAEPIGWTKGYGMVHLESLYPRIEKWLIESNAFVPPGYGNGPKVRWQNIAIAIQKLDVPRKCAIHGLKRQVFLFRHAENLEKVCAGVEIARPISCPAQELSDYWLSRWALPRAERDNSWEYINPYAFMLNSIQQLCL